MKAQTTFTNVLRTKNLQLAAGIIVAMSFSNNINAQLPGVSYGDVSYNANSVPINTSTTGSGNVAFGYNSLIGLTYYGSWNTALGSEVLGSNSSGAGNVGTGFMALYRNTTGSNNVANGINALHSNTTSSSNVAIGASALFSNTTGWENVANGYRALYSNTIGAYNTASGARALSANTAANRGCAFGWEALTAANGNHNAAFGFRALYKNTSGSENAGFGTYSLGNNITGVGNSGLGSWAEVGSGNLSNATALGFGTVVNASNKVRIGSASVTVVEGPVAYTISDGRFKTNVKEEDVKGLEFITKLRPVVYNFDTRKLTEFWTKNMSEDLRKQYLEQDFTASTNIRQSGFIAQEVENAAKEVNYNFNGVHVPENENDNYSLAYGEFVVPLVKGMQEQQKMIEEQKKMNEEQKKMIEKLQEQINELQKGGSTTGIGNSLSVAGASMDQNVPNPFSTETVINFNLPNQIGNAYMTVYDLSGKQIKTLPINQRGASSITITSDQLEAGMYIYSIVVDGKILDSKRMVVTGK